LLPAPLAALALLAWMTSTGSAIDIVEIQEHWELSIGEPDAASSSPQVSMVMSPNNHLYGHFFVFTLNHHSDPEWVPGGMQVQHWDGEDVVESHIGPQEGVMTNANEVVRWVQKLSLSSGQLNFEIVSGSSTSWGAFGGQGHLKAAFATNLSNLNNYYPGISIQQSGVCFAGNRVKSLTLTKLRWIDSTGQSYEMSAPIDVDADLDP
jgi:hypothetical protein